MLITSSHTPNCLRQIALAFLFLILFSCALNQKLLFFFQSFKKRYFIFTRLCLFRCLSVIALAVDHVIILFRRNLHCTQYSPFSKYFIQSSSIPNSNALDLDSGDACGHRNTDSQREQGTLNCPKLYGQHKKESQGRKH